MIKRISTISIIFITLFSSCQKFEWNNPYDPLCPKENYTPSSFSAAQNASNIVLSWPKVNNNITGYIIQRQLANGTGSKSQIANLSATTTQYVDADIIGGTAYKYFLLAYAGNNQSNELSTQVTYIVRPTLTTTAVTTITADSARTGGTISSNGGATITASGICWSTAPTPTIANEKTTGNTATGSFTAFCTNLSPETKYYVRAYATNSAGTSYGEEQTFTTKPIDVSNFSWAAVYPGECYTFVKTPTANNYFLVVKNGVQKTINGGTFWSATNWPATYTRDGLSTSYPGAAYSTFGTGNLVVASLDNGFYLSPNNGIEYINSGPVGFGCNSQSVVALSDGRFLASMTGFQRGIWKTSGTSNNVWSNKLPGNDPTDFTVSSNGVIYSTQRSADAIGPILVKSTDNGENWISLFNARKELEDCEIMGDSLIWADRNGSMFIANASATNFNVSLRYNFISNGRVASTSSTDVDMVYYPAKKVIIATSSSGISVSANNGMSWANYKLPGVTAYYNVGFADGYIYVCTKEGLYRTKY
jgi:hypothetical protein